LETAKTDAAFAGAADSARADPLLTKDPPSPLPAPETGASGESVLETEINAPGETKAEKSVLREGVSERDAPTEREIEKPAGADKSAAPSKSLSGASGASGAGLTFEQKSLLLLPEGAIPSGIDFPEEGLDEDFQASLRELLPVSPEEIATFRRELDERDEAMADRPPRELRTRTLSLSLSPGFTPPVVELTPNLVTALVFLDSFGESWKVNSTVLGSADLYLVEHLKEEDGNRVVVSPLSSRGNSNLVVNLEGHEIPLVIRLLTRPGIDPGRQVDGLIIFQVRGSGPKSPPELKAVPADPNPSDRRLYEILDGVIPREAALLKAHPRIEDAEFYALEDKLYVRARHSLLWPGYLFRVSGAGGWTVFEAPMASPVLMGVGDEILRLSLEKAPALRD
jgi:hypothetical protein